jgi:hypothetical protein
VRPFEVDLERNGWEGLESNVAVDWSKCLNKKDSHCNCGDNEYLVGWQVSHKKAS